MNILHVNKFHYLRGGCERIYLETANLLESLGHHSLFFSMLHPSNIPCAESEYFVPYIDFNEAMGPKKSLVAALRVLYYWEASRRLSRLLDKKVVDIVHLHNIYHQISPSILPAIAQRDIPMVMTLHDYKVVCPSYNLFSDYGPCEACIGGCYHRALQRRCVKGSLLKTALSVLEMTLHHKLLRLFDQVDLFISPSQFLKNKVMEMGFQNEIRHLPNYVTIEQFTPAYGKCDGTILYFGRLSQEKGVHLLIEAGKILRTPIEIAGTGPRENVLRKYVKQAGLDNIRFLGFLQGKKLWQTVARAAVVVLPSCWYENNPLTVLEAFAMGKPVVGARIGGIPELVLDGETGFTFIPGNSADLAAKIEFLLKDEALCKRIGRSARTLVEEQYSPQLYYEGLTQIYNEARSKHRRRE